MTTLAFDGTTLAVDKQFTWGSTPHQVTKLYKCNKEVFMAGCGDLIDLQQMANFIAEGMKGKSPKIKKGSEFMILNTKQKKLYFVDHRLVLHEMQAPLTLGSGGDFALTGMKMGLDAVSAIRLAAKMDVYTGFGVDSVDINGKLNSEEIK